METTFSGQRSWPMFDTTEPYPIGRLEQWATEATLLQRKCNSHNNLKAINNGKQPALVWTTKALAQLDTQLTNSIAPKTTSVVQ